MEKNKKIKTLLSILLIFIIYIFSTGISLEDIEIPEDVIIELHPDKGNYHMGSGYTIYAYDNNKKYEFIVKTGDGTFEWVERKAIDYKDYVEAAVDMWNETSGYEIINMEEQELYPVLAMGTITVVNDRESKAIASATAVYDKNDPDKNYFINEWTLTINVAKFERRNANGTYYYSDEDKIKIIAHEIGHIFGLGDLKKRDYEGQIMYGIHKQNDQKSITANDIQGMEVVTESFTSNEWVPVATDDRYTNHV